MNIIKICCFFFMLPRLIFADIYHLPAFGSDVIGDNQEVIIKSPISWHKLAIDYKVSVSDLQKANKNISQQKKLSADTSIIIPKQYILPHKSLRQGIVINMAEQRLYFFSEKENKVYTYPVAMGKKNWRTPTGVTQVKNKVMHPTWHVPESIREHSIDTHGYVLPDIVLPGPRNPLGTRAIYLKISGILIHGTNNQSSIGKLVSSGCIRMHNSNVEELFEKINQDTLVTIVNHPIKIGINEKNQILLEVHEKIINHSTEDNKFNSIDLYDLLEELKSWHDGDLNWQKAEELLEQKNGLPNIISKI